MGVGMFTATEEDLSNALNDELSTLLEQLEACSLDLAQGNIEVYNAVYRAAHSIKGAAALGGRKAIRDIAWLLEERLAALRASAFQLDEEVQTRILQVAGALRDLHRMGPPPCWRQQLDEGTLRWLEPKETEGPPALGTVLVQKGVIQPEQLRDALSKQRRLGEVLVAEGFAAPEQVRHALDVQRQARDRHMLSGVRVEISALDAVCSESEALMQAISRLSPADWQSIAPHTVRLIHGISGLRLAPLEVLMERARLSLAALPGGQRVRWRAEGQRLQVDRRLPEILQTPIEHLLRNALAHGIEPLEVRRAAGKREVPEIALVARIERSRLFLDFSDDGRGVDAEKVVSKAGLAPDVDEEVVLSTLFVPGFSTQDSVNDVAGRGVGLDAVREQIGRLGGTVQISSRRGLGCTVHMEIPLSWNMHLRALEPN